MFSKYFLIIVLSFASYISVFPQQNEIPQIKHFNIDGSLGGPQFGQLNLTYYTGRGGFMISIPRVNGDQLFYVLGMKVNLTNNEFKKVEYVRPKVDFFLGIKFGHVQYSAFWSGYQGYSLWTDIEMNFEFKSGINFYAREGAGLISKEHWPNHFEKTEGIILAPEIGIGYRF